MTLMPAGAPTIQIPRWIQLVGLPILALIALLILLIPGVLIYPDQSVGAANDIELRMKQGFSVFVMNWGDAGFKTVEIGRKAAGR